MLLEGADSDYLIKNMKNFPNNIYATRSKIIPLSKKHPEILFEKVDGRYVIELIVKNNDDLINEAKMNYLKFIAKKDNAINKKQLRVKPKM